VNIELLLRSVRADLMSSFDRGNCWHWSSGAGGYFSNAGV